MKQAKQIILLLSLCSAFAHSQAPVFRWAKHAGSHGGDYISRIVSDDSGNVYLTGNFEGLTISFGSITLTNTNIVASSPEIFIVKYTASGNVAWAKSAGGWQNDYGSAIAVDAGGNCYVTGHFESPSITFDTTTLINTGTYDMFIVKINAAGKVVWAKRGEDAGANAGQGVVADGSGNCYLTGYFGGTSITFGSYTLPNSGVGNVFIVKYSPDGDVIWASRAGGSSEDYSWAIAVDASDNSYIAGFFYSPILTIGTTTLMNSGGSDIFIAKYDPAGNPVWARRAGGAGPDLGMDIGVDPSGNSWMTGDFSSSAISFGSHSLTRIGDDDMFVVRYDPAGNPFWAVRAGSSGYSYGLSLAIDGSDNCYVAGTFSGSSIQFGAAVLTDNGSGDAFFVKYDSAGTVAWAKGLGGTANDWGSGITLSSSRQIAVAGSYLSPVVTAGSTVLMNVNPGTPDVFLMKFVTSPEILSVRDVPSDQGGYVRIKWRRASPDNASVPGILSYGIFRRSASPERKASRFAGTPSEILMDSSLIGYDYVTSVPAYQLPEYQFVVPTLEDSSSGGVSRSIFIITAQAPELGLYYVSDTDSGYSVDNIAPIRPAGFAATLQAGPRLHLSWDTPVDPDVKRYEIYRSETGGFSLSPELKIAESYSTMFDDDHLVIGRTSFYRIRPVDIHDNAGSPSDEISTGVPITRLFSMANRWNLISVPLRVGDFSKTILFPTAISNAFAYTGAYTRTDVLRNGEGYWLKFDGIQSLPITGFERTTDTVYVTQGWNMIGSLSRSVLATNVGTIPGGMILSGFFEYSGVYRKSETIEPGQGYWVKVNQAGKLVLNGTSEKARAKIVTNGEMPPPPPEDVESVKRDFPRKYELLQNYPNPANPQTMIRYGLPKAAFTSLKVYNSVGEQIAVLVDEVKQEGYYQMVFDGTGLSSGVYFYRIAAGDYTETKKFVLMK